MTANKPKPSGLSKARALLQPSAEELKRAASILAKINGAKGGKSRSPKKLAAAIANAKKARAAKKKS